MTKNQMTGITMAKETLHGYFTEDEWKGAAKGKCSLYSAIAAGVVVDEVEVVRSEYTVAELVDMLNSCAGDDCYGCNWFFTVSEDGKGAYTESRVHHYRFA